MPILQNQSFITAVKKGRVLSEEQKQDLLSVPMLPESYQQAVTTQLTTFDEHSKERESYLRNTLEASFTEFKARLASEGVTEQTKHELLEKARKQIDSFFPNTQD